jgi:uncharacterized protein (DUF1800 family)/predicted protein tyrosine phosphatase
MKFSIFFLITAFILLGCGGGGSTFEDSSPNSTTQPGKNDKYSYIPKKIDDYIAVRFLNKTTFGATKESVANLKEKGILKWLDEQLDMPLKDKDEYLRKTIEIAKKHEPDHFKRTANEYIEDNGYVFNRAVASFHLRRYQNSAWFEIATSAKDQLRKKVTYALSQIIVESLAEPIFTRRAEAISRYFDILQQNALGNYKKLLLDISFSSSMSLYLTFNGNKKAHLVGDSIVYPDENYAREIMQLFTIGLDVLNIDGTTLLDKDGKSIPTYTQKDITEVARVFTGWDIKRNPKYGKIGFTRGDLTHPCEFTQEYHDFDKKLVLGKTIPAGLSGKEDIEALVDILMKHQNIAPFISKILIQRLAKSNPSPDYVQRVAEVFNDNGDGIKGDLKAVIKAIFTDIEFWDDIKSKKIVKFKEPLVAFTQFLRAFYAQPFPKYKVKGMSENYIYNCFFLNDPKYLGQVPGRAFSVFNFYDKAFIPNDQEFQSKKIIAPEIQIQTESNIIGFNNNLFTMLNYFEKSLKREFNGNIAWNRINLDCSDEFNVVEKELDGVLDRNVTLEKITLEKDREKSNGETKREKALKALIKHLDTKLTGNRLSLEFRDALFQKHINTLYTNRISSSKEPLKEIYKYVIVPTIVAIITSNENMTE